MNLKVKIMLTPNMIPYIIKGKVNMSKWEKLIKRGCQPITIPKHEPIKRVYVEKVGQVVESEAKNNEHVE